MDKVVNMAVYIDQDMKEIAKETNKGRKADAEEIREWARQLLNDVGLFCEALDQEFNTDIYG